MVVQKKDFEVEKQSKENAIKYFPDFFMDNYSILIDKTLEELREEYLNYCEKYFTCNNPKDIADKINIKKAYDYIRGMLENMKKTYDGKEKIIQDLLISYEALIITIADYRFNAKWKKSYGFNQNQANRKILFEISLLKPMITMMLENIDMYFKTIYSISKISEFDNQLRKTLEGLKEQLDASLREIIAAKSNYQGIWNSVKRREFYRVQGCTNADLGDAKLEWKIVKNNGCHTILEFCRQMLEINIALPEENMIYSIEEIKKAYQDGIANIEKGPNYYSYLSEEERTEITRQNVLRKQARKNIV